MPLKLRELNNLLLRWQKEENNPYKILRIAIENNGIITFDNIKRKAPSIASPRAALNLDTWNENLLISNSGKKARQENLCNPIRILGYNQKSLYSIYLLEQTTDEL